MLGFRVWDSVNKKMLNSHSLIAFNELASFYCSNSGELRQQTYEGTSVADGKYIPMQSTGIKDCEGVTIYSGDFIRACYPNSYHLIIDPVALAYCVGENGWLFEFENYYRIEKVFVVGNVFENPEVMKMIEDPYLKDIDINLIIDQIREFKC